MQRFFLFLFSITLLATDVAAQKAVLRTYAERSNFKGKVKSIQYDKDELEEYDKQGNLLTRTRFRNDGTISEVNKYTYRKPGLLMERTNYDASNKLISKTVYEYDNDDYEIKSTTYNSEGKITYQTTTTYKDKNHYTTDLFDGKEVYKTLTITTDKSGNVVEEIATTDGKTYAAYIKRVFSYKPGMDEPYLTQHFDQAGKMTIEIQKEFDSKGNVIKTVEKGYGQIQTTTYEYTYDAKGNYTKEIGRGYLGGTYERTIVYY